MTKKPIRVILVNVGEEPKVIEIERGLESYYKTLGAQMIEAIYPFKEQLALVCDEEGKINGSKPNRLLVCSYFEGENYILDEIYGNCMIVGLSDYDFASVPKRLVDKVLKRITPREVWCND